CPRRALRGVRPKGSKAGFWPKPRRRRGMREVPSPALPRDPLTRRALELDALAAILPMDRRDRLAEILTDDDVATLKHLAKEGMGENSLRGSPPISPISRPGRWLR